MRNSITFGLIAGAAVLLFSCTKEVTPPCSDTLNNQQNLREMTFTSTNEDVRTSLNSDGKTISWGANDTISIFDGSGNRPFTVDFTKEEGRIGIFSGSAAESDCYYALYPYKAEASQTGNTVQYKFSWGSSWCSPNTFPKEKSILYAKADGNSLSFKHLSAYIKFTIPEGVDDLYEIIFFSVNKVPVSGTFELTFNEDGSVTYNHLKLSDEEKYYNQSGISAINSSKGGNFAPGVYYLPILPANLTKGFHIKFNHRKGVATRAHTGKALNLESGSVLNIGTVRKTNVFSYGNFEDNTLNSNRFSSKNTGIYEGKALGVIENPHKDGVNSSNYVLDNNMSNRSTSSATSGLFTIDIQGSEFCDGVKDHYNTIKMKVWLGNNDYYVRLCYGQDSSMKKLPSKVNGTDVNSAEGYKDAILTDQWNVFEWDTSTCWDVNSISQKSKWDIRPFEDKDGNGTKRDATHTHTVLFDDIEFLNYK